MNGRTTNEQKAYSATLAQVREELSEEGFRYWEDVLTEKEREEFIQGYIDGDMEIPEEDADSGTLNVVWEVGKMQEAWAKREDAKNALKDAIDKDVKLLAYAELACGACGGVWQQEIDLAAIEASADDDLEVHKKIHEAIDGFLSEPWTIDPEHKTLRCPGCGPSENKP